jgi:hypothetical protein
VHKADAPVDRAIVNLELPHDLLPQEVQ